MSMDYCIMRLKKRTMRGASAMARHALREDDTPNADPAKKRQNTIVIGPSTSLAVVGTLEERTAPLVRRKDAVRVIEVLVTGSPEKIHSMSRDEQDSYFKRSLDWLPRPSAGTLPTSSVQLCTGTSRRRTCRCC